MRIAIDLQGAQTGSRHRGIGRYTLALVKAMLANHRDHEFYIILNGMFPDTIPEIRQQLDGLIAPEKIRTWFSEPPVAMFDRSNSGRTNLAEYTREAFINSFNPDCLLITSLFEGFGDDFACSIKKYFNTPTAVILYDLIPMMYPQNYLPGAEALAWYFGKIAEMMKADLFLSISKASGEDAISHLEINPQTVVNISGSSDANFGREQFPKSSVKNVLGKFGIDRPYLMYTSATDERKNHCGLISAYANLDPELRALYKLVLAGGMPSEHRQKFAEHAANVGLAADELSITGHVTDSELNLLYNHCHAFVFPSWHEGFGLPILEAMRCGKAVIGSNCSSIPEVIGLVDALFDPHDIPSMAAKIRCVLTDHSFRKKLERHSRKQAKKFTWEQSAGLTLKSMEERLSDSGADRSVDPEVIIRHRLSSVIDHALPNFRVLAKRANVSPESLALRLSQNFCPASFKRQLLVDITELARHDAGTGIQRVVRSMIAEWLEGLEHTNLDVRTVFAKSGRSGYLYGPRNLKDLLSGCFNWDEAEQAIASAGDSLILLDYTPSDIGNQKHQIAAWGDMGVRIVSVVYDLLPLRFPEFFVEGAKSAHFEWAKTVAGYDGVVCISHSVADEFRSWIDEERIQTKKSFSIDWFHLGADLATSRSLPEKDVTSTFKMRPTFLMVGTLEPRKGHRQVLAAFEILWGSGVNINLVFIGKRGWGMDVDLDVFLEHSEYGKRFFWFEGASDEVLIAAYESSACVIVASYGEGFGLPLIEAAQRNCALMARDIPVFREVAGDGAYYFPDSRDPRVISSAVVEWLDAWRLGTHPSPELVQWISWRESAKSLLALVSRHLPKIDSTFIDN